MNSTTLDRKILNISIAIGILLSSGSLFLWSLTTVTSAHAAEAKVMTPNQGYTVAGVMQGKNSREVVVIGYNPNPLDGIEYIRPLAVGKY